jgi:hypothetical protein
MRSLRRLAASACLALGLVTAGGAALAADPLTMLLLTIAREALFAAVRDHLEAKAKELPPIPETYPGTTVEPAHVRRLVDEGFGYLTAAQRDEVFESLHRHLMDPKNAAVRGPMVEYFAERAMAMRLAQERLAKLSHAEKVALAADFRKEVAGLPPEEAARLAALLRKNVLPVPEDLNDMLIAVLSGDR